MSKLEIRPGTTAEGSAALGSVAQVAAGAERPRGPGQKCGRFLEEISKSAAPETQ